MKKNLFLGFFLFFFSITTVNAASYKASDLGVPTLSNLKRSGQTVIVNYKNSASTTVCKAMRCGLMIYEDKTDKIYRVSNTSTSLPIRDLQKGKIYVFSVAQYYIDKNGVYKNYEHSEKKLITIPRDNITCSFDTPPNQILRKSKYHNINFSCSSGYIIKSPTKPVTSKVKISTTKYGSLSSVKYVKQTNSGGIHKYYYSARYTATSKTGYTGGAYVTVQSGFLSTTGGISSPSFSSKTIKVDTKGPSVSASRKNATYKISKSAPLKVKFSCSDTNGIKSIKVNKTTYKSSSKTISTSTISNKLTYKVTCTDKASNTTTKTYTYKTLNAKTEKFLSVLSNYSSYARKYKKDNKPFKYYNSGEPKTFKEAKKKSSKRRTNCAMMVTWALKDVNVIGYNDKFWCKGGGRIAFRNNASKNMKNNMSFISGKGKSAGTLIKNGTIKKGDIICWNFGHTNVYAGSSKWYDAGRWGSINGPSCTGCSFKTFGPVKISSLMGRKVDKIIRIK